MERGDGVGRRTTTKNEGIVALLFIVYWLLVGDIGSCARGATVPIWVGKRWRARAVIGFGLGGSPRSAQGAQLPCLWSVKVRGSLLTQGAPGESGSSSRQTQGESGTVGSLLKATPLHKKRCEEQTLGKG